MNQTQIIQPVDARDYPIQRAMGLPLLQDQVNLIDNVNFCDIFDLSAVKYQSRVFTGISVRNLSGATTIELAFGQNFANVRQLAVGTTQYFTIDALMFGPALIDDSTGVPTTKVRARLGTAQGTPATGTITVAGNPADETSVVINGLTYDFSNDASPEIANAIMVNIAATANLTWANLKNAINANDQAVRASLAGGVLTLTSVFGGAAANAIAMADGAPGTGAAFSGATLTGATGGTVPVFHIW